MNVLLTGSSGYIGTKLIPHLKARRYTVTGLDRDATTSDALDRFVQGDLCDETVVAEALAGVDMVLHLAAAKGDWGISEEEYYRDNLEATRSLVKVGRARGIKNWVFYSTVAVMGPSEVAIDESADFAPTIAYGQSKAEAEQLFHQFAKEDPHARIMIVRPSAVFGRDHPPSTNLYRLIEAIRRNRFVMVGDGEALKTTSYIGNLIPATFFLIDRMRRGVQTYIYVDEPVISTSQMIQCIYRLLGKTQPAWSVPLGMAKPIAYISDIAASITGIDFPITAARIDKFCTPTNFDGTAIRQIGFQQPVSNNEALKITVDWHVQRIEGRSPSILNGRL